MEAWEYPLSGPAWFIRSKAESEVHRFTMLRLRGSAWPKTREGA